MRKPLVCLWDGGDEYEKEVLLVATYDENGIHNVLYCVSVKHLPSLASCPDSRKQASIMTDEDMGELGMLSSLFGVDNIFDKYCESLVYTENYFLFSVGYMQRDEKIQTVSVGVLGRVFVTKKPSELKALFDEWEW